MVFKFRWGRLVQCLVLLVSVPTVLIAGGGTVTETVQLNPVGDSSLIERTLDTPAADGRGEALYLGTTGANDGFTFRRALIAFDIAAAVPAGATIDLVQLLLDVNRVPPEAGGFQTRAHRVASPWTEGPTEAFTGTGAAPPLGSGDQTWQHSAFDTILWATPGGDFAVESSGSVLMIDTGSYTLLSDEGPATLESDVQSWLDTPAANFGWMLRGVEQRGTTTGKRLGSRENSSPPVLSVTYTVAGDPPPPPEPEDIPTSGTVGLLALISILAVGGWSVIQRR